MKPVIPTTAELTATLKARLDQYQVDGWEGRDGEEFYAALATVGAAAAQRAAARVAGRYILASTGATRATGSVRIRWAAPPTNAVGLRAGQVVAETPWGVKYYLTEEVEQAAASGITWLGGYLDGDGATTAVATGALTGLATPWTMIAISDTPAGGQAYSAGVEIGASGCSVSLSSEGSVAVGTPSPSGVTGGAASIAQAAVSQDEDVLVMGVTAVDDDTLTDGPYVGDTAYPSTDLHIADATASGESTGRIYAVLVVSGVATVSELRSLLTTSPESVFDPSRILRCYLPHLAYESGASVIIPDIAETLGGGQAAVDAVMSGGGIERIANTAGESWPPVSGVQTHDVGIAALWTGPEANVPAAQISQWALPAGVDPASEIAWTATTATAGKTEFLAAIAAGTVTIAGLTDATGGADGFLDLIASGRGLPRAPGESDAALRKRIRTLPDVVTPAAILRAVNAAMEPWGVTATMAEPWDYGFAFGVGAFGVNPPSRPWHFVVLVPSIPYDAPGFAFGAGAFGIHPIGTPDVERAGVYAGLQSLVDQIKAAGIWASVRESP